MAARNSGLKVHSGRPRSKCSKSLPFTCWMIGTAMSCVSSSFTRISAPGNTSCESGKYFLSSFSTMRCSKFGCSDYCDACDWRSGCSSSSSS